MVFVLGELTEGHVAELGPASAPALQERLLAQLDASDAGRGCNDGPDRRVIFRVEDALLLGLDERACHALAEVVSGEHRVDGRLLDSWDNFRVS